MIKLKNDPPRGVPLSDYYSEDSLNKYESVIPVDMYNESPHLYWYESRGAPTGQYVAVWRIGRQFLGYLYEPDYQVIDRFDMRFVGYGDMSFIESLKKMTPQ